MHTTCWLHQVNKDHTSTVPCIPTAVVGDWHYSHATNPSSPDTSTLHPIAHPPAHEGLPSPSTHTHTFNMVLFQHPPCPHFLSTLPHSHPLLVKFCPAHPPTHTHRLVEWMLMQLSIASVKKHLAPPLYEFCAPLPPPPTHTLSQPSFCKACLPPFITMVHMRSMLQVVAN
jgi:hypothetical protein